MATDKSPEWPVIPDNMCDVHAEILKHPDYKKLGESITWAFEMGCVSAHSWCSKANDEWSRKIWTKLHIDWDTEL